MFRRSISLLLCICMVLSMVPVTALAEETETVEVVTEETTAPVEETAAPAETQEETVEAEVPETSAPTEPEEVPGTEETVPEETVQEQEDLVTAFGVTSGTCGENVTWTFVDGVLTISGKGAMTDYPGGYYASGYAPWWEFSLRNRLKKIVIEDGITSIGNYAFSNCEYITSVSVPDSVTRIGKYAFNYCRDLEELDIPAGVTNIGEYAFYECLVLPNVTLPAGLTRIEKGTFSRCNSFTEITIPEGVVSIGEGAFMESAALAHVVIPDSVQSIGKRAFDSCDLTEIRIPNGILRIEEGTFSHCEKLTTVVIPDSVTQIDRAAFSNCSSLVEITIPDSVLSTGDGVFGSCENLKKVTLSSSLTKIEDSLFSGCENLTDVVIPDSVTAIGAYAFNFCGIESLDIPDGVVSIGEDAFSDCHQLKAIEIPAGVTSIEPDTFYNCKSLSQIEIPAGVTTIGSRAFYWCSSLTSIVIPDGVTRIEEATFYGCSSLRRVEIPASVTVIWTRAFGDAASNGLTVYYGGSEEKWANIYISTKNDPLLNARFVYNWEGATYWKALRLYSGWDEASRMVTLDDGTTLYVTDATAAAFRENPTAYLGQYVLVTAEVISDDEQSWFAVLNMQPLQSQMGYVTSATDTTITIYQETYRVPKDLKNPRQYVGKYIVYHVLNWDLLGVEALQSCEAYLTSWDPQTKQLGLRLNKLSDAPEPYCLYTDQKDILDYLTDWDGTETIVKLRYDSNRCVYTLEPETVDGKFSYMFNGTQRFLYSYHYDEGWFDESSSTYQHDLTRMSLRVAMASGDTRKGNVGAPYQNIANLMSELGFDFSETYSSYPDPEYDTIGYAIGSKEISSPGGQPRTLIMVGLRGIDYCDEWGGNFRIGSGMTEHEGFNLASEQVIAGLKNYIAANKDTFHPTIQIWISGYSRGGATTNLTAAKLIDGAIPEIKAQNVYAFCFECPRNTTAPNVRSFKYRQIVNIINPIDFVTYVAMEDLGFDRYGTDYILPNIESTRNYWSLRDGLYSSYRDILEWGYSEKDAMTLATTYITESKGQAETFRRASDSLAFFIMSRAYYEIKYQTLFMDAFAMAMGGSEIDGLTDAADSLAGFAIAAYNDTVNFAALAAWNRDFVGTLRNSTLAYAHMPTLCLAWLETVDTLDPEANRTHERIFINCPVDVEVYSDGELVGQILGDIPQEIPGGILTEIDEDGQKVLVLPGDGAYDIRLIATDDGEVTYTVTEQDSVSGDVSRIVSYQKVEICKDDVLCADTSSGMGIHSLKMQDGTDAQPDADLSGEEVRAYNVTVQAEGEGSVTGGGNYLCGEFAKVVAEPKEAAIFLGWYVNDVCVSAEKSYRFLVEQNVELTARFAHKDECRVELRQKYLAVPGGQTLQLELEASHEILKSWIRWEITEGESVISVDAQGKVTALAQGTARIRVSVIKDGMALEDHCRIDVTESLALDGVQLNKSSATTELFSTGYTNLEVLLKLPQNYTMSDSAETELQNDGVAIGSARFTDESLAKFFGIAVLDDRRIQIVPTDYAVENPKKVKSKYTGTVTVTVDGQEYETGNLTLTVKQTKPKLNGAVSTFNSFITGQSKNIRITGATVKAIYEDSSKNTAKTKAIPGWLTLKDGALILNENAPGKSTSAKAYILVDTEEWRIPAAVTLSVKSSYKAPGVKLKSASVTATTLKDTNGVPLKLVCSSKKDTLSGLGVIGITAPEGYAVENFRAETGAFTLKAENGFQKGTLTLKVNFSSTEKTVSLKVTVKTAAVTLKTSAKSITLNTAAKDSAVVKVTAAPGNYQIEELQYRLTNSKGKDLPEGTVGLPEIAVSGDTVSVKVVEGTAPGKNYRLYLKSGNSKEIYVTLSTVNSTPSVTLNVKGAMDLSFPESETVVTASFKNYASGEIVAFAYTIAEMKGKTVVNENAESFFQAEQDGTDFRIRVKDADSVHTGSTYTLKLRLTLRDGKTYTKSVSLTVKRTAVKLKLSTAKLSLNKLIGEQGTVTVSCASKGYDFREPVWELKDKNGKKPAEGNLDVFFNDGKLTVKTNGNTEYGTSYKLILKADKFGTASSVTVTVPAKSKSKVTTTLKASGSIDVIRDGSKIALTPVYKNCGKNAAWGETLLVYSSGDNYKVPVNSLFDIQRTENGSFVISKAKNATLDHRLTYKVKLVSEFDHFITVESPLTSVKISMGKARLTVRAENPNLFIWDKHSRVEFQIAAADKALNGISGVRIKEAKYQTLFEIHPCGNNRFAVGFAGNEVAGSLRDKNAPKNVTLTLQVLLKGNAGTAANTEVKLKINLVQSPLAASVSIVRGDADVTGSALNLYTGDELTLTGISKPDDAVGVFSWSSSNPAVATVNSSNGVIRAKKVGTATITCTAIDGSGKYASVTGNVNPPDTGFTVVCTGDWDSITAEGYRERLIEEFHAVYPRLYARFAEGNASKTVTVKADSTYEGVAYASGSQIVISVDYANTNPLDLGFFAHELTHVVQNYGNRLNYGGDAWWTENLANYARFRYYAWVSPETVKVYSKDDLSLQDWGYKSYGSCEWFFAYLDDRYPTVVGGSGERIPGLIDTLNSTVKGNQGEQLDDDPRDTATLFNRTVQEITGFDCIESLRIQYARELQEGSWCFKGFGSYRDNFLTENLPGVKNPEYPMMTEPVHGQKTAAPVSAITSGTNLCAGASVFAVSGEVNDKERAELLIDGNFRTKWCCTASAASNQRYNLDGTRQWIILDLGEEKEFNTYTVMNTKTVEPSYGNMTQWELLVSNDAETWISADYQPDCDLNSASFRVGAQRARYVMLRIYNPDDSQAGTIRLYEFMLYRQ